MNDKFVLVIAVGAIAFICVLFRLLFGSETDSNDSTDDWRRSKERDDASNREAERQWNQWCEDRSRQQTEAEKRNDYGGMS